MHLTQSTSKLPCMILIMGILLSLTSCSYLENIGKEGDIVTSEQSISEFNEIVIEAPYHLHLIQSDEFKIVFEGMDYLMDGVIITEEDGILTLDHSEAKIIQKSKKLKASIYYPLFAKLRMNKPIDLTNEGVLNGNTLSIVFNGRSSLSEMSLNLVYNKINFRAYGSDHVGEYNLEGECEYLDATIEGYAKMVADELSVQTCNLNHKSINYCKLWPDRRLDVHIYSWGDTYYKGDPIITQERVKTIGLISSGEVIKID